MFTYLYFGTVYSIHILVKSFKIGANEQINTVSFIIPYHYPVNMYTETEGNYKTDCTYSSSSEICPKKLDYWGKPFVGDLAFMSSKE